MTIEQRRCMRISCSVPVLLRLTNGEPAESWGVIYDISLVGIKLETRRELEKNDTIFVSFELVNNFIFENTRGKVVRLFRSGGYLTIGVEFDNIIDKNHLKDALHSMLEG